MSCIFCKEFKREYVGCGEVMGHQSVYLASGSSVVCEEERFRFCPRCGEYLGGPVQVGGPSAYNNQQRLADVLFPRIMGNWGQMAREFDQLGITIPPVLPGKHVWARIGKHAIRHTVDLVRLTMIPIGDGSDFTYGWEIRCREDNTGRSADFTERDFGDSVFLTMTECQKQIEEDAE